MNLCAFSSLVDHRRVNQHVRMMLFHERDAFRCGDDADHANVGARRRPRNRSTPRRRCRRSPASDRSSARSCAGDRTAASSSTSTRSRSPRRAAGRCGRRARPGAVPAPRRASPGRRAAPARRRRPCGPAGRPQGPSGVGTVDGVGRHVAHRLGGEQHADPDGRPPEHLRRRRGVAQRHQGVVHERMLNDVQRHEAL